MRTVARLLVPVIVAATLGAAGATAAGSGDGAIEAPTGSVAKIVFVDVAQGDAVVMKIGGKVIVSDVGEYRVENVDAALRGLGAKQIDVAILSHPHDDHVKNLEELISAYGWKVKLAVLSRSDYWEGTRTNRRVMRLLRDKKVPRREVERGNSFDWGGADWQILNPPPGEYTGGKPQAANASIVYLLKVNGAEALFTGDIERKVAKRVATELAPLVRSPVEIFLATHHGSKEGSIDELLDLIRPTWAVLSTGDNKFGHPAPEAIDRLKRVGASIWCTDVNGSITATISTTGKVTWRAGGPPSPWWSAKTKRKHGNCVGR